MIGVALFPAFATLPRAPPHVAALSTSGCGAGLPGRDGSLAVR
jgi:hypothetical protein